MYNFLLFYAVMGRTKRKRNRNKRSTTDKSLDNEHAIISLLKWMKSQHWKNQNCLRLREFEITGRGVFSTKNFAPGDSLIQVPYKLLITFNTIHESALLDVLNEKAKLKIQDFLILFLILERIKGYDSKWHAYIESLPQEPPWLPLKLSERDVEVLNEDIRDAIRRSRCNAEESWKRLRKSINPSGYERCVLDVNSFTWAFTMVNTRAVYVDPQIIHDLSEIPDRDLRRFLSDEPCMALCPFLDMFNHSSDAKTAAELKSAGDNGWFYELRTLSGYKKYEQIFISYGSHDNLKLLCEYGFFIPWGNRLDSIKFDTNEVLNVLEKQISSRQMRFLLERKLNNDLYFAFEGISFNLKAFLYFLLQTDINIWTTCVFNENYSKEALDNFQMFVTKLLQNKLQNVQNSLLSVQNGNRRENTMLADYLKYQVELISYFLNYATK